VRLTGLQRDVFRLALPALGALIAEPLFLLTDAAMVGHLGATALASLGLAGIILQTLVGLMIFFAYATTPRVARLLGSGNKRSALEAGIDGLWFAAGLGVVLAFIGSQSGRLVISFFEADADVASSALDYLDISWWGMPGMLLVLAATGVLRGLHDTMTPFRIAIVGFTANAAMNAILIYGLGLGLIGSAIGTVIAQWLMAIWLMAVVIRLAAKEKAHFTPRLRGLGKTGSLGGWLLIRTISLRVAFVGATVVAARLGTQELATWHVAFTVFGLLALALDSLAIAAQTLVGHRLGGKKYSDARKLVRLLTRYGLIAGVAVGGVLALASPPLAVIVTSDQLVRQALIPVLIILALSLPIGGVVFVLDGVLMGAGDVVYLAWTGVVNVAVLIPLLWAVSLMNGTDTDINTVAVMAIQASVGFGYLGARWLTLGLRTRRDVWMKAGEHSV
jgi:putative MATE family efflux protein